MGLEIISTAYGQFCAASQPDIDHVADAEPVEVELFQQAIALVGAELVIDVAAGVGVSAVYSLALPCVKRVIALEASAPTYAKLAANLAVQTSEAVIESHCRSVSASPVPPSPVNESTLTVDSLVDARDRIVAIHLQASANECSVLNGAIDLLRHSQCVVRISVTSEGDLAPVQQVMSGLGYVHAGFVNADVFFLHPALGDRCDRFRELMFVEMKRALTELARWRRKRRKASPRQAATSGAP